MSWYQPARKLRVAVKPSGPDDAGAEARDQEVSGLRRRRMKDRAAACFDAAPGRARISLKAKWPVS